MTLTELSPQEQLIQQRLAELHVTNQNAQYVFELAQNPSVPTLREALAQVEESVRRQAALDIIPQIAEGTMTATQIRSVFYGAMLRRSRTLEYFSFEILYSLLRTIRDESLAQAHPANYTDVHGTEDRSFLRMAQEEAGISASVASDIMALGDIILPYIEQELNIPRGQVWSNISQTNLRNMIPVLRVLINMVRETGDNRRPNNRIIENAVEVQHRWLADREGVPIVTDNDAMRQMTPDQQRTHLNEVAENRRRIGRRLETIPAAERVLGAVEWLIDNGETMPSRAFAQIVGNRTDDPFDALVYHQGALIHFAATMTEAQWENLQRIVRTRMNALEVQDIRDLLRSIGNGTQ